MVVSEEEEEEKKADSVLSPESVMFQVLSDPLYDRLRVVAAAT